jgi:hypothetical protein
MPLRKAKRAQHTQNQSCPTSSSNLVDCGSILLCLSCFSFLRHLLDPQIPAGKVPDVQAFNEGLKDGCHICLDMLESIRSNEQRRQRASLFTQRTPSRNVGLFSALGNCISIGSLCIKPEFGYRWGKRLLKIIATYTMPDEPQKPLNVTLTLAVEVVNLKYPRSTTEESIYGSIKEASGARTNEPASLARQWLSDCFHHRECQIVHRYEGSLHASRLVHIGQKCKIVETKNLPPTTQYTTLSHRWAAEEMFCLLTTNIQSLQESLPEQRLPPTFVDAFKITKDLNVEYIWIDSLCILQDSQDDWARESAKMGDIYANGECNISAAGGGRDGLLRTRDTFSRPRDIEIRLHEHDKAPVTCVLSKLAVDLWLDEVEHSSLNRRGWVLQERLLSRRILHFGKGQLFWECQRRIACESFPEQLHLPQDLRPLRMHELSHETDPEPASETFRIWRDIVRKYSLCLLTRSEDKLVALAGIASSYLSVLGASHTGYVAGLWEADIISQLLWHRVHDCHGRRPQQYRAPSFSWASLDGPVSWFEDNPLIKEWSRTYATFINHEVTPVDNNKFGQLASGYIRLKGGLYRARSVERPSELATGESFTSLTQTVSVLHAGPGIQKMIPTELNITPDVNSLAISGLGPTFYLLMIGEFKASPQCANAEGFRVGLVLERTSGPRGQYRRQGLFVQRKISSLFMSGVLADDMDHSSIPLALVPEEYEELLDDGHWWDETWMPDYNAVITIV